MILADGLEGRKKALAKLLHMQKQDFKGIFKAMDGLPVIIRLLDPPLHEFLPKEKEDIETVAREIGVPAEKITAKVESMHEFNPMLGFRGCRLGVTYPEITEMQARAILEAAMECKKEGIKVLPQIEVPLVGNVKEFNLNRDIIRKTAAEIGADGKVPYQIGTMIEVPRAALTADEIAREADFMSFGTNDLTQMGCGFSRDDAGRFLGKYVELGIYARDPFQAIDRDGVGELMRICVRKARSVKPHMEIGICGEHGGEPSSVEFCHLLGMNDVSCSPFRVPIARLAAAQAAIRHKNSWRYAFKFYTQREDMHASRAIEAVLGLKPAGGFEFARSDLLIDYLCVLGNSEVTGRELVDYERLVFDCGTPRFARTLRRRVEVRLPKDLQNIHEASEQLYGNAGRAARAVRDNPTNLICSIVGVAVGFYVDNARRMRSTGEQPRYGRGEISA